MKVFKFGGASIKNVQAIQNMIAIIGKYQNESLIIIVSAMGKSTNALEELIDLTLTKKKYHNELNKFEQYHKNLIHELPTPHFNELEKEITFYFNQLKYFLERVSLENYSKFYDRIVSIGELLSSTIISFYLKQSNIKTLWADARTLIKTDHTFQDGKVDWDSTATNITTLISSNSDYSIFLTQGYIGSTHDNETTTLGREGSDYTAAIFASCLNAESVTIWKDVPGILNADPKIINDAILFKELPYNEASEMTYYGAKVIHPKTIKPLANKKIPLHVRCFETPENKGTIIRDCILKEIPTTIIYKENQCLVSFKSKDLSFINEKGLSILFNALHQLNMTIHIMQNSAISFSVCIDYHPQKVVELIKKLSSEFIILYNTGLQLVTIKNYTNKTLTKYKPKGELLLEQVSRNNYRILFQPE